MRKKMKTKCLLLTYCLLVLSGCGEGYSPFKIEKAEFFDKVKTVGLLPVSLQVEVHDEEKSKSLLEENIQQKLRDVGFSIIPSSEYKAIYDNLKEAIGPLYDPNTGNLLKEKYDSLKEHTKREYLSKHKVDAFVYPSVVVVKAEWRYNRAIWHGVEEPSTGKSGFLATLAAPQAYGTLPALSLRIGIGETNDEIYYLNYGGIQLCSWVQGRTFVDVPQNQLLADETKVINSIDIAMDPLLDRSE
jgi:hypothetical protein